MVGPRRARLPNARACPRDTFELVDGEVAAALGGAVEHVASVLGERDEIVVAPDGLGAWMDCMRTLQGAEIWESLGAWVREREPDIGPGVRERIEWTSTIEERGIAKARVARRGIVERMYALLGLADVLALPSAPRIAPRRGTVRGDVENAYAAQTLSLTSIAGLASEPPACHARRLPDRIIADRAAGLGRRAAAGGRRADDALTTGFSMWHTGPATGA